MVVSRLLSVLSITGVLAGIAAPAAAEPLLQLYVEGSTYDDGHESWVYDGNAGAPIRLWVIGNVDGPGGQGPIEEVRLSAVYSDSDSPSFNFTPSTTGGYGGFDDPSTPGEPTYLQTVSDGSTPTLGDGSSLPPHGTYGSEWEWQEWLLGDLTRTDSPVADFIETFPSAPATPQGQINVYEVAMDGVAANVHFDVYDHVAGGNHARYTFAPFSHDAGTGTNEGTVPEPAPLALIGLGLIALGWARHRRQT